MRTLGMAMTVGLIALGLGCDKSSSLKVTDASSSDVKRDSGAAVADTNPGGTDASPTIPDANRDSSSPDTSIADAARDSGIDLRGIDSGATNNGRSVGSLGQCANANCAGAAEFSACMTGTCDSDLRTCFGTDYANGNFSGACAGYISCIWQCPCDASAKACEVTCAPLLVAGGCLTCLSNSACMLSSCGAPPACILPTPAPVDGGSSSGVDGGAATGCAKALGCCSLLESAVPVLGPVCRNALAGRTDAECNAAIAPYSTYCP